MKIGTHPIIKFSSKKLFRHNYWGKTMRFGKGYITIFKNCSGLSLFLWVVWCTIVSLTQIRQPYNRFPQGIF